jgi:hypothetical protein
MSEQAAQNIGNYKGFITVVLICAVPHIYIQQTETNMCLDNISNNAHSFWKMQLKDDCNVAIQYGILCPEFNHAIPQ